MTENEKYEQYIVDRIQNALFDGWVNEGVRGLSEVQKAGQKWSRDLLTMVLMLVESYPSIDRDVS